MPIQLEPEVYKWLLDIEAVPKSKKVAMNAEGKFMLDPDLSGLFETGLVFPNIIKYMKRKLNDEKKFPLPTPPNMKQLKEISSPAAKLYNWNIITDALSKFGYNLEPDIKSLIVAGDVDMVAEVLRDLFIMMKSGAVNQSLNQLDKRPREHSPSSSINSLHEVADNLADGKAQKGKGVYRSPQPTNKGYKQEAQTFKSLKHKTGKVDIDHIDIDTPLTDASSLLEFLIVSISKNLSLNAKQATALLLGGNKYLAHVIVKGVKGDYAPIVSWYQDVYGNSKHLLSLVLKEESTGSVTTILQVLKPGLLSKHEEVAQWTLRLYSKLVFDFSNLELSPYAWDWFINENGGLFASLVCLKRHQDIGPNVVAALTQFGRFNMLELFTVEMQKILSDSQDYLNNILLMIRPLTDAKLTKDELLSSTIIDFWLEYALKHAESHLKGSTPRIQITSLSLVCEIWELYPNRIEEDDILPNQILTALKRAIREKSRLLKTTAITLLFRLLENFAAERNPYAPIFYKTLTFCLIENHNDSDVREYIIHNFCSIFENSHSIPVGIIVEPLVKQLQTMDTNAYTLNVFDFKLLDGIASHSRLAIKNAVQLLDVLAKIYLNDVTFAHASLPPIVKIVSRFIEDDSMQEYLQKLGKIALSLYYSSVKKKKSKDINIKKFIYLQEKDELFAGPNTLTPEMEQEILSAQKRALIIELLKNVINMKSEGLNARIKTLLAHTNKQIKQYTRFDNKGIKHLLALFGDPDEIIKDYDEEGSKNVDLFERPKEVEFNDLGQTRQPPEIRGELVPNDEAYNPMNMASDGMNSTQNKENRRYLGTVDMGQSVQSKEMLFQNFMESQSQRDEKDTLEALKAQNSKIGIKESKKKKADSSFWSDGKETNPNNTSRIRGNMQAHLKALEKLDEIQRKKEEKKLALQLLEEYKKKKDDRTKNALKKLIEERRIELGVEAKFLNDGDVLVKKKDKIEEAGVKNTDKIYLVHLDDEEEFQREAVSSVLRQNVKAFRYLFAKYCVSLKSLTKLKSLDAIQLKQFKLSIAELWKCLKDYGLTEYVTKDEMVEIMRLVNKELMHSSDYKNLDYEGFVKFLFQISVRSYPDISHLPYVEQLRALLRQLYMNARDHHGEHKHMFEDAGVDLATAEDRSKATELTEQVNHDPTMNLPPGFKKVMENNVNFHYDPPIRLKVPSKYKVCYDVVNDLLKEIFEINLYEPFAAYSTKFKVVPISQAPPKDTRVLKSDESGPAEKKLSGNRSESKFDTRGRQQKPPGRPVDRSMELPSIKNQQSQQERPRKDSITKAGGIVNKVVEEKMRKELEEKIKEEQREQRRQERLQELDKDLKLLKDKKKEEADAKAEREQNHILKKEHASKLREDIKRKELDKKKELLRQYKEKKQEDLSKQIQLDRERRKEQENQKKKEAEQFIGHQKKKFHENFENIKKSREEEEKQKRDKESAGKKKNEERKKKMDVVLEKERERREGEKKFNEKLQSIQHSEYYQAVYKKHDKSLKYTFDYYKEDSASDVLPFSGFMHFAAQLNIFPALLNPEELNLIFRSLTRDKSKAEMGLKYDEFQQSLLRMSIKAKVTLNKLHDKYRTQIAQDAQVQQSEMKEMINAERRGMGEQPLDEEQEQVLKERVNFEENTVDREKDDIYHKIDEARPETLETLIFYMDLPTDRKLLAEKLKSLRKENAKVVAPRDKKRAAGRTKLNESFEGESMKFVSPKHRSSKSPNRDSTARKQNEKLETVDHKELARQPETRVENIKSPQGNVENWQVQGQAQGQYQGQYQGQPQGQVQGQYQGQYQGQPQGQYQGQILGQSQGQPQGQVQGLVQGNKQQKK